MQRLEYLYEKYIADSLGENEKRELVELIHFADDDNLKELAGKYLDRDVPAGLSHLQGHMDDLLVAINARISQDRTRKLRKQQPNRWRARVARALIAAVFLSLLSIGYYFWRNTQVKQIIVTAGKGKVYDVKLPDGSRVWLNSGASLSYPELLKGDKRSVILTDGQAFFEVSENPNKPFTIKAGTLNVQVLGTSFEVSAFKDVAQATVAVKTGSVKIGSEVNPTDSGTTLTANQKATVNMTSGNFEVTQIDGDDIAGWKENKLVFASEDFPTVLKALERKYNVTFKVENQTLTNKKLTLKLDDQPISEVLEILSISSDLKFTIADDSTILIR